MFKYFLIRNKDSPVFEMNVFKKGIKKGKVGKGGWRMTKRGIREEGTEKRKETKEEIRKLFVEIINS